MNEPLSSELDAVRSAYEATLSIPSIKPAHQYFLCPVGLVGSGKSTVLSGLTKELSLLVIESDGIRKLLKERGLGYDPLKPIVRALFFAYAKIGYSIALDSDGANPETREMAEDMARKLGASVIYLHINPPEHYIIDKLTHFKHTWLFTGPTQALQNYKARKPIHEDLRLPYAYTFDPSQDLAPQWREAILVIREATGN